MIVSFRTLLMLLVLCTAIQTAFAQKKTIAILPSEGVLNQEQTEALTDNMHKAVMNVVPEASFTILRQEIVIKRLGGAESYVKECIEGTCIVDMGRKAQADYVAKASVGRLEGKLRLKIELYNVETEGSIGFFDGDYDNFSAIRKAIDENAHGIFRKIPGVSSGKPSSPLISGGISGLQSGAADYEMDLEKRYLTSISTDPEGATLSINGEPVSGCAKTPCKAVLGNGNARIIAVLEQYEKADTTVSIAHNNQSIAIKLKVNFGVFEVKPAYSDGMGKNEPWSFALNGKAVSSFDNKLSPGNYAVKLSHKCYEDISFNVGINKGSRETFDMASHVKPKKGGLILDAENNGELVSVPVLVNGKKAGETPFSGTVPLCAEIEAGGSKVNVSLKHNEKVTYKHDIRNKGGNTIASNAINYGTFTDSRDKKRYKTVKIGNQVWMAQNLNVNAPDSKCYDNKPANCEIYGRLYDWHAARSACPKGWHLPTKAEWEIMTKYIGGEKTEGEKLKAKNGWDRGGNGQDAYGFAALPGGYGYSDGSFLNAGIGYWWSVSGIDASYAAYSRYMIYDSEGAHWYYNDKSYYYSIRCLQD